VLHYLHIISWSKLDIDLEPVAFFLISVYAEILRFLLYLISELAWLNCFCSVYIVPPLRDDRELSSSFFIIPGRLASPYAKGLDSLSAVKTESELFIKLRWLKLCKFDAIVLRLVKVRCWLKGLITVLSSLENYASSSFKVSENLLSGLSLDFSCL